MGSGIAQTAAIAGYRTILFDVNAEMVQKGRAAIEKSLAILTEKKKLPPEQQQDYATWGGEKIRKVSPLGRWQTPPEYAAMAVFLASDHARNVTGQTLNIDGGQVMHS